MTQNMTHRNTPHGIAQSLDQAFCLQAILAATTKELYVIETGSFRFVTANASALRNLNLSRAELQDKRVDMIFEEVDISALKQYLSRFEGVGYVVEPILLNHLDAFPNHAETGFYPQ